jgi:hypothetical protein
MRHLITSAVAALAIACGALAVSAVPASAATVRSPAPVTASTTITGRPDSGGNGNWATDAMTRTIAITSLGGGTYTAILKDARGTFTTGAGDFVPNQSASPGLKFTQAITGTFTGTASFAFTASQAPDSRLVPRRAAGTGPTDTSDWYKLAFPAGTVFGGTGIENNWGWSYTTPECLIIGHGRFSLSHQAWRDFASNNGGQGPGSPAAGSITDFSRGCLLFP